MRTLTLALTVVFSLIYTSANAKNRPPLHKTEQNIVYFTNIERVKAGLPTLKVDSALMRSSRSHCYWMSANSTLTHSSGPYAENIACGQRNSREAVHSWMSSRGHRANILGRFRRIGVSAFRANNRTYWCQQFK